MTIDAKDAPIDPESQKRMRDIGLRYDTVDAADVDAYNRWAQADGRGFLDGTLSEQSLTNFREGLGYRRTTGVWDETTADPATPVGTTNSWVAELSIPGARTLPSWAISSVTVAPTHRRRGIARALLEGELRTAAEAGVPMAMLTVSEATLYERYGFAPAAFSSDWKIITARARWIGPEVPGRVDFVSLQEFRDDAAALHERTRTDRPGEVAMWPLRWDQLAGIRSDDSDRTKNLRAARYVDGDGTPRGALIYRITGGDDDFAMHTFKIEHIVTETSDAYAALWRYALEHPLVGEVAAYLQSVDEPVRWMIADQRAAAVTTREHQWLRVIDVIACLEAREYSAPGMLGFDVTDALGFAAGSFLLTVDSNGVGTASAVDALPSDCAALALSVNELSAIYLGGVSAVTLTAAGRVHETRGGSERADAMFRSSVVPYLSLWY